MVRPFELHDLLIEVALRHDMLPWDLLVRCRYAALVRARQEFFFRALRETSRQAWRIGAFLEAGETLVLYGAACHARRTSQPAPRGANYDSWRRWQHWTTWTSHPRHRRAA